MYTCARYMDTAGTHTCTSSRGSMDEKEDDDEEDDDEPAKKQGDSRVSLTQHDDDDATARLTLTVCWCARI